MAKFIYEGQIVEGTLLTEADFDNYQGLILDFDTAVRTFVSTSQKREIAEMLISTYDIRKKQPPKTLAEQIKEVVQPPAEETGPNGEPL